MLLLKRHLVELVKAGKKRQTIRLWSRPLLRANQVSYTPGLGKMLILAIEELPSLQSLTESDAHADGFASLKELLAEIRRIYGPKIPPGRSIFRIRFQWPHPPSASALPANTPPVPEPPSRRRAESSRQAVKSSNRRSEERRPKRPGMTTAQRKKLLAHILAQAPAAK